MSEEINKNSEKKELSFKERMLQFKNKAVDFTNKTIDSSAKKLSESGAVLKSLEDFKEFIDKSKNTSFTNKETWETKFFTKRVIVIFVKKETDFYKDLLALLPVLMTKAWSQGVSIKISEFTEEKYKITEFPSLVVFENKQLLKTISGEENIKKIVKTLNLDINSAIDSF